MNPLFRFVKASLRSRLEQRKRAPADVVIVSFPKAGRTWLRLMIGKALCDLHALPEVGILDTLVLTRAGGLRPTTFCHDGTSVMEARHLERLSRRKDAYVHKKVLLLAREPRDVVTSCYFQASRRRRLFKGSIAEFIRDPRYGIRKILTWYNIWNQNVDVPREFAVVRYEDLRADTHPRLRSVLEFMGVPEPGDEIVQAAVAYARYEKMRRMEQQQQFRSGRLRPGRSGDEESFKTRRAKVGGYVDYLEPGDLSYCEAAIAELGYPFA